MKLYLLSSLLLLLSYIAYTQSDNSDDIEAAAAAADDDDDDEVPFVPKPTDIIRPLPGARVLGGRDAATGQFPYQVSVRINNAHTCGGSIISRTHIVTAAHCVMKNNARVAASTVTIRAGTNLRNTGGVIARVTAVITHPNYRTNAFNNDIALLRLTSPLNLTNQISIIPLATAELPSGAAVVISGWGRTSNGGGLPNNLKFNTLRAINNAECRRRIGNVPTSILCLEHSNGNGACSGDSGGPGVYNGQLVGVTNFVINRCGTTAPDGYAKVSAFVNWLRQNAAL